jgi:hypothetical protein
MLCTESIRSIVFESTNDHVVSHVVIRCSNVGQTVVVEWRASISISSRFTQRLLVA